MTQAFQVRLRRQIGSDQAFDLCRALIAAVACLAPLPALSQGLIGEEGVALACSFHTECRDDAAWTAADLPLHLDGVAVELARGSSGLVATLTTESGEIETVGFLDRNSVRAGGEDPGAYHLLTTMTDGARYTIHDRRKPVSTTYIGRCE